MPPRQQTVPLGPDQRREEAHGALPLQRVAELTVQAEEQVNKKRAFEETWLKDQRPFHGQSNGTADLEMKQANKSGLVVHKICPRPADGKCHDAPLHGVLVTLAALLGRQAAREIFSTHLQKENAYVDGEV